MAQTHRTYWVVRQRYRRIGYAGAVLGACFWAVVMVPYVHGAQWGQAGAAPPDLLSSALTLIVAVLLPPVIARLLWWMHRGRYIADMYRITVR